MADLTATAVATRGFFADGKWIERGEITEIHAPYDGSVIGQVFQGTRADAGFAIASAVKAFGTTRRLPAFERQRATLGAGHRDTRGTKNLLAAFVWKRASPLRRREPKSSAPSSPSTSQPRKARAFMASIFRWIGRSTRQAAGVSFAGFLSDLSRVSRLLIFR